MIQIYQQPQDVLKATRLCLEHKLYVENWAAVRLFSRTIDENDLPAYHIAFKWLDGVPIAWCLKFIRGYMQWRAFVPGDCWRYTMPIYRHKGIGKQLWMTIGRGPTFGPHDWHCNTLSWDNVNTSHEDQITV